MRGSSPRASWQGSYTSFRHLLRVIPAEVPASYGAVNLETVHSLTRQRPVRRYDVAVT